jgi:hypothetical protein
MPQRGLDLDSFKTHRGKCSSDTWSYWSHSQNQNQIANIEASETAVAEEYIGVKVHLQSRQYFRMIKNLHQQNVWTTCILKVYREK